MEKDVGGRQSKLNASCEFNLRKSSSPVGFEATLGNDTISRIPMQSVKVDCIKFEIFPPRRILMPLIGKEQSVDIQYFRAPGIDLSVTAVIVSNELSFSIDPRP